MRNKMSLFVDETGSYSTSRVLLWIWSVVIIHMLYFQFEHLTQPVLTFLSGVYLFLASWAAGPRMAKYLAPQISRVANAIGNSRTVTQSSDIFELSQSELKDNFKDE